MLEARGTRLEAGIKIKAMRLGHKMRGEEHVLKSVSAKDYLLTSGQLVDMMEYLIPGVLRHQADECIQANDGLLIEMIENGGSESIAMRPHRPSYSD